MDQRALNKDITEEEVTNAIRKLKNGKATGPDGVPNEILKWGEKTLSPILTHTFNQHDSETEPTKQETKPQHKYAPQNKQLKLFCAYRPKA